MEEDCMYKINIQCTSVCPCFHSVIYVHSLNSKQSSIYQGSIGTMTKSLFISAIAHKSTPVCHFLS